MEQTRGGLDAYAGPTRAAPRTGQITPAPASGRLIWLKQCVCSGPVVADLPVFGQYWVESAGSTG